MREEKYERLSLSEYELVSEAIFMMVSQCPVLPVGVPLKYLDGGAGENITVIPIQDNAQYKQWYIDGSFSAQVDFQVAYKAFPTTNGQKIDCQKTVADIMTWLENTEQLPLLTEDRKITGISVVNSFAVVDEKATDGNTVFVSLATLTYRKKAA